MADNPVSSSGVSGAEPVKPPYGPGRPGEGGSEELQKPFSAPEAKEPTQAPTERPSPMEVASDTARQQSQMIPPQELSQNIEKLQNQLNDANANIKDPAVTQKFSADHHEALRRLTQKMNPDMQNIAKHSDGEFTPAQQQKGQSPLEFVSNWINGSQGTLSGALQYLQTAQKPDPASYLRLQYAVQRATQRGELFASIIGSSVSGIKTLMSTQLG